ncbi:kynurenine 3-monooxygenase [Microthyrium microscopicum]|uniref:Kynurenine 3-monooxygenase n=1 Tax=Microthyrium microscopicum TaxID=703497 RepID=A0A6A6U2S2_9PEZI|nr:kynurenine 3-monooxygenase [Microthyrium microscopicum]
MAPSPTQKTIVVGAGPVGCLAALYAATRGEDVEIYELRGDLRDPSVTPLNFTKSINLALSERGINAMRHANRPGLLDSILRDTIPMHGRMIHSASSSGQPTEESQAYDAHGRFIRAADRGALNARLLDELETMPNVKFFFHHKLAGADFKRKRAWFEHKSASNAETRETMREIEVKFDFLVGADGAHSSVRYHLMKYTRMDYKQSYIDTLWCEFHIPPLTTFTDPEFRLSPHHLHIWPGNTFMFIAIPSTDKSFTCTLFLQSSKFAELDEKPETIEEFFRANFPGVTPNLITPADLISQYKSNPHLPLISITCTPYHYTDAAVILGDAAHAMVPFYGQGMNAGLEDVRVLYSHLDAHKDRAVALEAYTTERTPDAAAISAMAQANYKEMSADVKSTVYLARKRVEEWLSTNIPWLGWATQYSRVSFGNERYSVVQESAGQQARVLRNVVFAFGGGVLGTVAWWAIRSRRVWRGLGLGR